MRIITGTWWAALIVSIRDVVPQLHHCGRGEPTTLLHAICTTVERTVLIRTLGLGVIITQCMSRSVTAQVTISAQKA